MLMPDFKGNFGRPWAKQAFTIKKPVLINLPHDSFVNFVTFARDQVRISSYADDVIVGLVEAWADTVPALA